MMSSKIVSSSDPCPQDGSCGWPPGSTFVCDECEQTYCYCEGAHDDLPNLCCDCWEKYHENDRTFDVQWSEEDQKFVGTCLEYPSFSWLDPNRDAALAGIRKLVAEQKPDLKAVRFNEWEDCRPYYPNDRCGGCNDCIAEQIIYGFGFIGNIRDLVEATSDPDLEELLGVLGLKMLDGATHKDRVEALLAALDRDPRATRLPEEG